MEAGLRTTLFREVNDRIHDLGSLDGWEGDSDFLCECGADCGCRVSLARAVYEAVRRSGRPILAPECAPATTPTWRGRAASGHPAASI